MSDARQFHKRGSQGERIMSLGDFNFRVWHQYVLSSDDFGVMRASASVLMADNPRLERAKAKKVQDAMKAVLASGLVRVFLHQSALFWWQVDWQDFQAIRYPRETMNPVPPIDELALATTKTLEHFQKRANTERRDFRDIAAMVPRLPCAGGRETLTQAQAPTGSVFPEESARETNAEPRWAPSQRRQPGLVDGVADRQHGTHAWCSLVADRDGLCVPGFLHSEFVGKSAKGPAELFAWYGSTVRSFHMRAVGDDTIKFWRNQFAAWVGTVTAEPANTRERRTLAASQRTAEAIAKGEL